MTRRSRFQPVRGPRSAGRTSSRREVPAQVAAAERRPPRGGAVERTARAGSHHRLPPRAPPDGARGQLRRSRPRSAAAGRSTATPSSSRRPPRACRRSSAARGEGHRRELMRCGFGAESAPNPRRLMSLLQCRAWGADAQRRTAGKIGEGQWGVFSREQVFQLGLAVGDPASSTAATEEVERGVYRFGVVPTPGATGCARRRLARRRRLRPTVRRGSFGLDGPDAISSTTVPRACRRELWSGLVYRPLAGAGKPSWRGRSPSPRW